MSELPFLLSDQPHFRASARSKHKLRDFNEGWVSIHDNRIYEDTSYDELAELLTNAKRDILQGLSTSPKEATDNTAQDLSPDVNACRESLDPEDAIGLHLVRQLPKKSAKCGKDLPEFCQTSDVLQLIKVSDLLLESLKELTDKYEKQTAIMIRYGVEEPSDEIIDEPRLSLSDFVRRSKETSSPFANNLRLSREHQIALEN